VTEAGMTLTLAAIGFIAALTTTLLFPFLRTKISSEKFALAVEKIRLVVGAAFAEGKKNGWDGNAQKAWAIEKAQAFGIDLSSEQYDIIRKAVVDEIKSYAVLQTGISVIEESEV